MLWSRKENWEWDSFWLVPAWTCLLFSYYGETLDLLKFHFKPDAPGKLTEYWRLDWGEKLRDQTCNEFNLWLVVTQQQRCSRGKCSGQNCLWSWGEDYFAHDQTAHHADVAELWVNTLMIEYISVQWLVLSLSYCRWGGHVSRVGRFLLFAWYQLA